MHGVISRYIVNAVGKWFGLNVNYIINFIVNDTNICYINRQQNTIFTLHYHCFVNYKLIKTDEIQGLFL